MALANYRLFISGQVPFSNPFFNKNWKAATELELTAELYEASTHEVYNYVVCKLNYVASEEQDAGSFVYRNNSDSNSLYGLILTHLSRLDDGGWHMVDVAHQIDHIIQKTQLVVFSSTMKRGPFSYVLYAHIVSSRKIIQNGL